MRASLSAWILSRLEKREVQWGRRFQMQVLLNLAARSFDRKGKSLRHLSADEALEAYAAYTVECMQTGPADAERLYRNAYRLGARLRRITGLKDEKALQRLIFTLYRNLGITMQGSLPGNLTIPECAFSRWYTPAQCAVMSHVDAGVIAGVFGGGSLQFTRRLTEGCAACRACFRKERG